MTSKIPCPAGKAYLPYQIEGVEYALARPHTLIGDHPGLGKTIQAAGVMNALRPPLSLVLCPAHLKINWQRELEAWTTRPLRIQTLYAGVRPQRLGRYDVTICNYDILHRMRKYLDRYDWGLMIADECQYLKSRTSRRTRAVLGSRSKASLKGPTEAAAPLEARRKLFLSGTPILNRPIDLWPICESLDPNGLGRSFTQFALRYCGAYFDGRRLNCSGAKNLDELNRLLHERFMIRRTKEEVLKDLPRKRRQIIELPAEGGAQQLLDREWRVYEDHPDYAACVYRGKDPPKFDRTFGEMSKARLQVALAKLPQVIEHLRLGLEEGPRVCFAHHHEVVDQICEAFPGSAKITGRMSSRQKQQGVDRFQEGEADLIVGNLQAMGTGWTLTRACVAVFAELSWTPGELLQAEDRLHRITQLWPVLAQYLVLEDSLDAGMVRAIVRKMKVIQQALD